MYRRVCFRHRNFVVPATKNKVFCPASVSFRNFWFTEEKLNPNRRAKLDTKLSSERINQLVERYRRDLATPDHTLVTSGFASRRYNVTEQDLQSLPCPASVILKENPYDSCSKKQFRQYWLPDVVELAKTLHGPNFLIDQYRKYVESGGWEEDSYRKVYGWSEIRKELHKNPSGISSPLSQWINNMGASRGSIGAKPPGLESVKQSFKTNVSIFLTKVSVWWVSGSAAMLADAMHSMADVLNAIFRYYGIQRSESRADAQHPYGHHRRKFVFADRSLNIVLFFGCIVPFWHGWVERNAARELLLPELTILVFIVSAFFESLQVRQAYAELKTLSAEKNISFRELFKRGSEMVSISIFTEACVGMLGSLVGIVGVCLAWKTGYVIFDSLSGMGIATLVGAASVFLLQRNEEQLVGCTLPIDLVVHITQEILSDDVVTSIHDIKTEVYSSRAVRFKAEVHFNAEAITRRYTISHVPSPQAESCLAEWRAVVSAPPTEAQLQLEDWVMQNNARFLSHLSLELKRVEGIVRKQLQWNGYTDIHVDLEPW